MSICLFCGVPTRGDVFCSPECYDDHQLALQDTQEMFMDELPFCEDCQCNPCNCHAEPQEMTDVEADADTFRSCGWGTDEDYYIEPYDCDLWNEC